MHTNENITPPKAILVGTYEDDKTDIDHDHIQELSGLAKTAGFLFAGEIIQKKKEVNPRFFLSKGRLNALLTMREDTGSHLIIFDGNITQTQNRNLEDYLNCPVIDRCGLILKIFGVHAKSKEAKIQVELADLKYSLTRLTGKWDHLSRQRGGIGLREVGEKQLELDKRLIKNRIIRLTKKLKIIDKEKKVQRKSRTNYFTASLVGYTNAGKSTIMNLLTGSETLVEDKLFATLDSTIRLLKCNLKDKILLSDTVGFIDKLPHLLVASFKSTLDEIRYSDILIKVVDLGSANFEHQMEVVNTTLKELHAGEKEGFWVFNKTDTVKADLLHNLMERFPTSIFISAAHNVAIGTLINKIEDAYKDTCIEKTFTIRYEQLHIISLLHKSGHIEEKKYLPHGITLKCKIKKNVLGYFEKLIQNKS